MRVIDTHCHPQYFVKENSSPEFLQEAANSFLSACFESLDNILMVAITLNDFELLHQLATMDERAHMSIGVHPCHAHESSFAMQVSLLQKLALEPLVKALGETGLDNYHSQDYVKEQEALFCAHIECASVVKKPVIVHTRSAGKRTLEILKDYAPTRGVIHCFTEDLSFARGVLDLGWMISFSGIVTFPKASDIAEVVKFVPKEFILVETDAPYLAPVPYRGKTNYPVYVTHVARYVCELLQINETNFINQLHKNYQQFLNINK